MKDKNVNKKVTVVAPRGLKKIGTKITNVLKYFDDNGIEYEILDTYSKITVDVVKEVIHRAVNDHGSFKRAVINTIPQSLIDHMMDMTITQCSNFLRNNLKYMTIAVFYVEGTNLTMFGCKKDELSIFDSLRKDTHTKRRLKSYMYLSESVSISGLEYSDPYEIDRGDFDEDKD